MCPVADRPGLVVLREDGELPTAVTLEGSGWSQENPESASESLTSFCWTGVGNSGKRLGSSLISAAVTRLTAKQNLGTEKTRQKSAILTLPLYFCFVFSPSELWQETSKAWVDTLKFIISGGALMVGTLFSVGSTCLFFLEDFLSGPLRVLWGLWKINFRTV